MSGFQMNSDFKSRICPFVEKPFAYCYCFNLTSRDIDPAIYYCSKNFEVCEIYKKNFQKPGKPVRHKENA
jgi:hypothetical protein